MNTKVKLIHISALGLENARDSKYAMSKINGEKLLREIFLKQQLLSHH